MNFVKDILRGIVIGIANIIPGVSGGTMMVSMGIYDKIIGAINNLFKNFKQSVKTVLPYGIGILIGIIGFAYCIEYLFKNHPVQTSFAFIGLILGGVPVIAGRVKGKKASMSEIILFIVFFALIIVMQKLDTIMGGVGAKEMYEPGIMNAIVLFIMGVIAAATMVIPGVSGSLMLMALGYYNFIIECINNFVQAVFSFDIDAALQSAGFLIPFGIGVVIGIFAVARLIEYLLKKHERKTIYSILGLIIASPIAVIMEMGAVSITAVIVITSVIACVAGFVAAFKLCGK